uniref:CCHC-type domain-containing protein n=1 Tax=Chenopodium quinoa TaxID=63459 RepID=A0A803MK46_CHEQI
MVNQAEFAALLDELKKINARLDKSEEVTALLQQEQHNRETTPHIRNHIVEEIKLADFPLASMVMVIRTYTWIGRGEWGVSLHTKIWTIINVLLTLSTRSQEKQKKSYPSFKPQIENSDIAPSSLDATSKHDKLVSNLKKGQSSLPQSQQKMKQIVCFKCQGMGHIAKQCPNKALVTKEEYYMFLSQNVDESDVLEQQHQQALVKDKSQDVTDSYFWENQQVCYAEDEPKSLILRSSCHHEVLDCSKDKRERRDKMLHMRKGTNLQEGSKVWLSLDAQRLHIDHKNGEPMDEGPFDIAEKASAKLSC